MYLKEYSYMIYVKLQNVNFPATVINERSHVAHDLILKNMPQVKFLG